MLEELEVRNYALIEHIQVSFNRGLNILTGETGAGKSILVGALGLLLGGKGETETIRTGAEEAVITGLFRVESPEARNWLLERSIEPEDGTVLARRVLKAGGRGSIYIQSVPVTKNEIAEFTSFIFDLHGQHEHQSLLQLENQRRLLDRYGETEEEVSLLGEDFSKLTQLKKEYETLLKTEKNRLREMDLLQYSIKEIEDAALKIGEEEELEREHSILSQYEKLYLLLEEFTDHASNLKTGYLPALYKARSSLEGIRDINPDLSALSKRLEDSYFELEDISQTVKQYHQNMVFDPEKLSQCEERLHQIRKLKKKYGDSIEEILNFLEESKKQYLVLENWEEEKGELLDSITGLEKKVLARAKGISLKRKSAALNLQGKIEENLRALGMPKATFIIEVTQRTTESGKPACGPTGIDQVEFTISPNSGEPAKPLRSIASGGELSRIMLAIKSVLAEKDSIQSLIFDEIDSGIGGDVALSVGEHLQRLSKHKQVLCITHLASIAVRADNHIKIEKRERAERTITEVRSLAGEQREEEIARMLSGKSAYEVSLAHARELLIRYGPDGLFMK